MQTRQGKNVGNWCAARESNPHALRQRNLNPSCLPFHQPREKQKYKITDRWDYLKTYKITVASRNYKLLFRPSSYPSLYASTASLCRTFFA